MKRILVFLLISSIFIIWADAQTIRDYIRRGNRLMLDTIGGKDLSDKAIIQYKKAFEIDSTYALVRYNLGNALLRQGKPQDAMKEYVAATKYEKDKQKLSDIYHNMGVLLQASERYAEAVDCYKNSLRNDPSNHETRYNYVLALWHLKNNQNENEDQKDQEQKDKKEDQQGQDKKENPQSQDQNKEEEQKQQQQKQQQQQVGMSKEVAERLLKAAMRNEKETQEKIQRQQQDAPRKRLQKQW